MPKSTRPSLRTSFVQPEDLLDKLYKAWLTKSIDKLPDVEQKVLERMEYADRKLTHGGVGSMYFNLLDDMEQYFRDHNVTRRTLENDIDRAKKFFLSTRTREDKEYARGKSIHWLERALWKAEALEDMRAFAALMKEYNEIQSLKKDDPNLPEYDKVGIQHIFVTGKPTDMGVPEIANFEKEMALLRGSKADFLSQLDIEEAELDSEDEDGTV